MSWTGVGFVCDSQATSKMPSWCLLCAFCLNESHESNAHSHCHRISWRKYSIYPLCGQGLSSPPLSPEFCMQAGAAMWKRGLRNGEKGAWRRNGLSMSVSPPVMSVFFFSPPLPILHVFCIPAQIVYPTFMCARDTDIFLCDKALLTVCISMSFPSCLTIYLLSRHVLITLTLSKDWR